MTTRAISFLNKRNIPFDLVIYEHVEKGAEFAARATGYPLELTVKTLVVEIDRKQFCLALLPGSKELSLKKLAAVVGAKRAAMVDVKTAERLTGYSAGGISPFGTRQGLTTVMEASVAKRNEILINAGRRGMMLKMAPGDIVETLACRVAPIAVGSNPKSETSTTSE